MFFDIYEKLCKDINKSPTRVGRENGIKQQTVSQWKNRGTTPSASTVTKLANYFEVSVDFLLGLTDDEHKIVSRISINDLDKSTNDNDVVDISLKITGTLSEIDALKKFANENGIILHIDIGSLADAINNDTELKKAALDMIKEQMEDEGKTEDEIESLLHGADGEIVITQRTSEHEVDLSDLQNNDNKPDKRHAADKRTTRK